MNLKAKRRFDALLCIRQFRVQHPEVAAKPAAKLAFDAVDAAIDEVEQLSSGRLHSTNTFLSASAERQAARAELHEFLSDLSRISKTLDRAAFPDIAAQLKMGRLNAYQDLLSLARNAVVVITPIQQAFIDRGAPETLIEDIESMITALELAANRRNRGLGSQIATNTSLRLAARQAMDHVRILDGILNMTLKRQPGLLAEWNAAKRLRRREKRAQTAAPAIVSHASSSAASPEPTAPQQEQFPATAIANHAPTAAFEMQSIRADIPPRESGAPCCRAVP